MDIRNQIWYKSHINLIFYVGIGTTISDSIGLPDNQFEAHIRENYPDFIFVLASYETIELTKRNLKTKRTVAFDGISSKLLL